MSRKKLGKYEIIDRIGRGGMAEVYRGYHPALDRYVAIKLLHPFLADDPEFKDRFENEARNVAKLKHPNIVQVYDFEYDEEGDSYYMVMEMINGPTLKDRLFEMSNSGDDFATPEAIRIIANAAEALAYAHQRSMIHRDVKPANLMLDEDSRVVLTDFGIAKIVTGTQFTASGGMVGTPAYMAPEQGLGEAGDERSDIYSLGVILYQLITHRLPYDAETPLAIILKHVNEPLPAPSEYVPDIPEVLEQIICKSLAKEPPERYQSASEFAHDLARLNYAGQRFPLYETPAELSTGDTPIFPQSSSAAPPGHHPTLPGEITLPSPPEGLAPPARVPGRLRLTSVLGLSAGVILLVLLALAGFGGDDTPLTNLFGSDATNTRLPVILDADQTQTAVALLVQSDTPTPTTTEEPTLPVREPSATPNVSSTPSPTVPNTDTPTPTQAPTDSPTPTPTSTATETQAPTTTPTPNMTGTALAAFYETQAAKSPTPNMTQTIAACDFEYIVVAPERYNEPPRPQDFNNPRLIPFDTEFSFDIIFRNTGSCPWPNGARLTYNPELSANPGTFVNLAALQTACTDDELRAPLNFAYQEQSNFYLDDYVDITEESLPITFTGSAPAQFGCYYGVWELLYPNSDVRIGRPLLLTIRVWGSGN